MSLIFTPSTCHIDLGALRRNFKRLGSPESIMPVIKSDAYGHGLLPCARTLNEAGATRFAVGLASEGAALRDAGLKQEIALLMGCLDREDWALAKKHGLLALIRNFEDLEMARACAESDTLRIAIKCDTGMSRLGFTADELPELTARLSRDKRLEPVMLISHLACADMPEQDAFTKGQTEKFDGFYKALTPYFPGIIRSLGNSAATVSPGWDRYECVRPGLAIYGGNPLRGTVRASAANDLEWVMSVSSPILQVRQLEAGQTVSYGRIFTAREPMRIAIAACGYATGVHRNLSNKMGALVHGRRVPQIGRICMSMLMLDVSDIPDVRAGDLAWIMGGKPDKGQKALDADEIASLLGTIPYEVLCHFGAMNPRKYSGAI